MTNPSERKLDELADRLADACETFNEKKQKLLADLYKAKTEFDSVILDVEDWAISEGLIPNENWTDTAGDPFLPVSKLEIQTEEAPDLATLFRERVSSLRKER